MTFVLDKMKTDVCMFVLKLFPQSGKFHCEGLLSEHTYLGADKQLTLPLQFS
jgi:hypothetical protein